MNYYKDKDYSALVWSDKKHYTIFDPQIYLIYNSILTIQKGFLSKNIISTPLYKVKSVQVYRSLLQRFFGLCTMTVYSAVSDEPIIMKNVIFSYKLYMSLVTEIDRLYREILSLPHYACCYREYGNISHYE